MPQESLVRNPFLMMSNPEVVLAAIERSERLTQLNRHFCRPLDRPITPGTTGAGDIGGAEGADTDDDI
jgi:hypothetical protein